MPDRERSENKSLVESNKKKRDHLLKNIKPGNAPAYFVKNIVKQASVFGESGCCGQKKQGIGTD